MAQRRRGTCRSGPAIGGGGHSLRSAGYDCLGDKLLEDGWGRSVGYDSDSAIGRRDIENGPVTVISGQSIMMRVCGRVGWTEGYLGE